MMSPDSAKWLEAMKSEMGSMYENKVWTLVDLPDDRQAIENKWIFERKTDADTSILHHAFISIFIALWTVISLYVTILMAILSYFTRFT